MQFSTLNLSKPILKVLEETGYQTPTPIQERAIPVILQKRDVLACAQTGTGKTASFSLPLIQFLSEDTARAAGPRALILAPTRELAIQIGDNISVYARLTPVKHTVVFGGVSINNQIMALRSRPAILVATPGRLLDLLNQRAVSLQDLRYLVLDEADRMLDMGFIKDIRKIMAVIPANRQTLLFSATMPKNIEDLAGSILKNPERIAVTPVSSTVEKITQAIYPVSKPDKISLLSHLIKEEQGTNILVFSRTKHGADKIVRKLKQVGIAAEAIHGNKSQQARQKALTFFKTGKINVLVATDIAARGIDVDNLQLVINYDLPNEPETYVHRIGRTGRAGASGRAWSFCDAEEWEYLGQIQKLTGQTIPTFADHPFASTEAAQIGRPSNQIQQGSAPNAPKRKKKKRKAKTAHVAA